MADFKEKYREIAGLLHDTQEELKSAGKRRRISAAVGCARAAPVTCVEAAYLGAGRHDVSGMFSSPTGPDESEERGRLKAAKSLQQKLAKMAAISTSFLVRVLVSM